MAATVILEEHNDFPSANSVTNKTGGTIRPKGEDKSTVDANFPLQKPAPAAFTYSFEKWLRLKITVVPTGVITNLQFYTTGGTGGGTQVYIADGPITTYVTPVLGTGITGYTLATTFTSGARKSMGAGPFNTLIEIGNFAKILMRLDDTVTAPQNPTSSLNLFFSYDET